MCLKIERWDVCPSPLSSTFYFLHFSGTFLDPPCENKEVEHKRNFLFIKFIAYIDRCRIVSIFTNYSGMKKINASNKKSKKWAWPDNLLLVYYLHVLRKNHRLRDGRCWKEKGNSFNHIWVWKYIRARGEFLTRFMHILWHEPFLPVACN